MAKATYTDDEIRQILQALFQEKKKTKDLNAELQRCKEEHSVLKKALEEIRQGHDQKQTPGSVLETDKLKKLLAALKSKYEQSAKELIERDKKLLELQERVLQVNENDDKDYQSLVIQMNTLKKQLQKANEELEKQRREAELWKNKIDSAPVLDRELQEQNTLLREQLEISHTDNKAFIEEFQQLTRCLSHSQQECKSSKEEVLELRKRFEEAVGIIESLKKNGAAQNVQDGKIIELEQSLREAQAQAIRDKARIEKLALSVQEKENRIIELQQIELSLKRSTEQKQQLGIALEYERTQVLCLQSDKERICKELEESRAHAEQLERSVEFLRQKNEDIFLDSEKLKEESQKAQEIINVLKEHLQRASAESDDLSEKLKSVEIEKNDTENELVLLLTQFEELKQRLQNNQKELEIAKDCIEESENQCEILRSERESVTTQLLEKTRAFETFEREINLIKQTLVRGIREAKEVEEHFQNAIKERATTTAKLQQAQHLIEKQRDQNKILQEQLDSAHKINVSAHNTAGQLQRQWEAERKKVETELETFKQRYEHQSTLIEAKELDIDDLRKQLARMREDRERMRDELEQGRRNIEDKDLEIRQAQQHMAKKVKEAALLEDRAEELRKQILDQQQAINQDKIKMAELQTGFDLLTQQQMRLQEQLQETQKASDLQQTKWEQKYFSVYEKWQGAENRIKDLEKMEEKHKQLQGLFVNFGSCLGISGAFAVHDEPVPAIQEAKPAGPKIEPVKEEAATLAEAHRPYQSLFNMPKSPPKQKTNLLD